MSQIPTSTEETKSSSIVELRQYTLYPGKRDTLIDLFEGDLLDPQEEMGAELIGQFRDLENPNRFVWLRGFPDMPTRGRTLEEFYNGLIWKAHREKANATMEDSDNVFLLRTAWPGSGFFLRRRVAVETGHSKTSLVTATICHFESMPNDNFLEFFRESLRPVLARSGAPSLAAFVSESSPNNYPRLPVREGENVFVWFTLFTSRKSYDDYLQALIKATDWPNLQKELQKFLNRPPQTLRLLPTPRSKLS